METPENKLTIKDGCNLKKILFIDIERRKTQRMGSFIFIIGRQSSLVIKLFNVHFPKDMIILSDILGNLNHIITSSINIALFPSSKKKTFPLNLKPLQNEPTSLDFTLIDILPEPISQTVLPHYFRRMN